MSPERRSLIFDHAGILLAALLIGFILPGHFIAQAPSDFAHLSASWLRSTALLIAVAVGALAATAYWVLRLLHWRRLASGLIWLVVIWASTAGLVVPIVGNAALVEMGSVPIAPAGLATAAAIAATLLWLSQSRFRRFLVVYLAVMLVATVVSQPQRYADAFLRDDSTRALSFATLSGRRNVLVISFDGISGAVADQLLREQPAIAAALRDFTLYTGAIANAPATDASMRSELFGDRDFKAIGDTDEMLRRRLDLAELPLNQPGVDAMAYAMYGLFATSPQQRVEIGHLAGRVDPLISAADTLSVYRYVAVRLVGPTSVRIFNALGARGVDATKFVRRVMAGECRDCGLLGDRLLDHKGADWDRPFVSTINDIDGLADKLRLGPSPFSLRYMHFLFSHYPVDFDATCGYRSDNADWFEKHQSEAGLRAETRCVFSRLDRLLRRLKDVGAYDNSLIIVKSDHGAPASDFAAPPQNYRINGHPLWGYDRYRPLLMIKDVGETERALRRNERLTPLSDLAKTLCRHIPQSGDCDRFPGADIERADGIEGRYWVYIPPDANATHSYGTHVARSLPRSRPLLDSLISTGDIKPAPAAAAP